MSFDLAVWHSDARLSNEEATQRYIALCEEADISLVTPHPAVDAFYEELTSIHPEIDDMPVEALDDCPWNCAMDRSPGHVTIACAWSRAEYCSDLIVGLARKHGLCVYDPQAETLLYPDGTHGDNNTGASPWWKFWRK